MAVSLPSDLIADVMRNADPARRQTAVARLQALGTGGSDFASMLNGVDGDTPSSIDTRPELPPPALTASPGAARKPDGKASAFQGFERMVLRNLFEALLPDEKSGSFGTGPSAGIWRSMAADQLAGVYAQRGGIGIGQLLASSGNDPAPRRDAEWPYFALQPLKTIGSTG